MVNIYDYAHNLARALKECPENQAFQAAREKIKAKPAVQNMIADLQRKRLELQAQAMEGKEPSKQQQEALERLFGIAQQDPDAREFLMAEQRFMVIMNDINKIIAEAIDPELAK
jgi:cell fate (sporulation/competence/biofilm development) regulator YlbF (YheA/YmcA/DUF963 family)